MAIEDYKHQSLREGSDQPESNGEWEVVVHDCSTPSLDEVRDKHASVNSIWRCGGCGHKWKLINHTKHNSMAALAKENVLVWRRITPVNEGENEK